MFWQFWICPKLPFEGVSRENFETNSISSFRCLIIVLIKIANWHFWETWALLIKRNEINSFRLSNKLFLRLFRRSKLRDVSQTPLQSQISREHCECQIHVLTASQIWLSEFVTDNVRSGYLQKSLYRNLLILAICMSLNFQSEGFRFRTRKYPELSTVDEFAPSSPVWRWSSTAATAWFGLL